MSLRGFFNDLLLGGTCRVRTGSASPEGAETAGIGSLYLRTTAGAGAVFYVKESGSGNTGWVAMASASSNAGYLQKAPTVTLTDAQVKALPTTPFTLLAAPGAGLQIIPVFWIVRPKFAAGAYTNINADAFLQINYAGGFQTSGYLANAPAPVSPPQTLITTLFGANNWTTVLHHYAKDTDPTTNEWGMFPIIHATANLENKALQLVVDNGGSGNFTGGNAANTWPIDTYYVVAPV